MSSIKVAQEIHIKNLKEKIARLEQDLEKAELWSTQFLVLLEWLEIEGHSEVLSQFNTFYNNYKEQYKKQEAK